MGSGSLHQVTMFCTECESSFKGVHTSCPTCKKDSFVILPRIAKVPKRGNKRKMKKFRKKFLSVGNSPRAYRL